jgi:hypothetical protein
MVRKAGDNESSLGRIGRMMEPINAQTARENLLYIRKTLEAAGQVTAIPGKGLMAAGFLALLASAFNAFFTGVPWSHSPYPRAALGVWGAVLVASIGIIAYGMYRKSLKMCTPISPALLRKLLWSLCPALFAGALLTALSMKTLHLDWIPVIWLSCYGAAVAGGGQFSVAPVRFMGFCFLLSALGAVFSFPGAGLAWLAISFGWLHLVFGAYIARRHNG